LVPVSEPDLEKAGNYSRILFAIELPIYIVELRGGREFLRIGETPRRMRDKSRLPFCVPGVNRPTICDNIL
jgi:hypothetical protein